MFAYLCKVINNEKKEIMETYKIVFQDSEGNELFSKVDEFYNEKDAENYAKNIVANSMGGAEYFEIYEA